MVPKIRQEGDWSESVAKGMHPSDAKTTTTSTSFFSTNHNGKYYYLTEDARKNLKTYNYRGVDMSLLYKYILSPLAAFLVNTIIPRSMAPNTITSIGFVLMISSYVAYWWYVPSLELTNNDEREDYDQFFPPRWIFLWNGLSILIYQTLDNMDGKQARRTGSSSPLGLIFDHGCDAINSIFGSANVIIGMNLNPSENFLSVWLLVFGPFLLFYIATWEHYFTGELNMPIVNGPSEGLLGTALLSFVSYKLGSQYWQQTDVFDSISSFGLWSNIMEDVSLRNCDLIVIAVSTGVFQETIMKTLTVTQKCKGSAAGLIPMFVLAFCYYIIGYIDPNIWLTIPRTSLHLSMVLFVEMSTELMLAHVTSQPFLPWRWQLSPLIGITCWAVVFGNNYGLTNVIVIYTWVIAAYLVMKFHRIISEMCGALEIWCFDIVTPHYSARN